MTKITEELLNEIHNLQPENHIVIGTILRKYPKLKLNENNHGIMINVTTIPDEAVEEIIKYLEYLKEQQEVLDVFESEADKCKQLISIEQN